MGEERDDRLSDSAYKLEMLDALISSMSALTTLARTVDFEASKAVAADIDKMRIAVEKMLKSVKAEVPNE
jgi:hypothetical protein